MKDAHEIMLAELPCNIVYGREQAVDGIIAALTSAGFRILGPDEIDGQTVEKCAEVADKRSLQGRGMVESACYRNAAHAIRALKEKSCESLI